MPQTDQNVTPSIDPNALMANQLSALGDTTDEDALKARADSLETNIGQTQQNADLLAQADLGVAGQKFQSPPPQRDPNILGNLAPLLLLSAFGGKITKQSAANMLAGTTGMVQGYLAGDEKAYNEHVQAYRQAYQQFKDHQAQEAQMLKVMEEAYKGRIDYQTKALESVRKMLGDETAHKEHLLDIYARMQDAAARLKDSEEARAQTNYFRNQQLHLSVSREARESKAAAQKTAEQTSPLASAILGEMAAQHVSLPVGSRSAKVVNETLNSLADQYPDKSAAEIVQMMKSGTIDMKDRLTAAGVIARREANANAAINTLTAKDGIFDQLTAAARKVNMGSAKFINSMRLAAQGHAVADPNIQVMRSLIEDAKTDMAQVLSRGGVATDKVRTQTETMFPDNMSFQELQAQIAANVKVAHAVQAGNKSAIDALKSGSSIDAVAAGLDHQPVVAAPSSGWGAAQVMSP